MFLAAEAIISQTVKISHWAIDGGHSWRIWTPWSFIKSSYNLWYHLESRSHVKEAWNSSEHGPVKKSQQKSTVVNCAFNQGLEGVRWLKRPHSCPYKSHLAFQRSRLKELKSDKKFPKMEMTCNSHLPKMESYAPQNYFIIQASNQILSNMKVEDLDLTIPKSPRTWKSHIWLSSYGPVNF